MIVIALGANKSSFWGRPPASFQRALRQLAVWGHELIACSSIYLTSPDAPSPQPAYFNAVALMRTTMPPETLLRVLKQLEHAAGRRLSPPNAPRPLDLDLIAYHRLIRGWEHGEIGAAKAASRKLVLPHPRAHLRPFVMGPLMEIHPSWHHPVTGEPVATLWRRLSNQKTGRILEIIPQNVAFPCEFPGMTRPKAPLYSGIPKVG